MKPIGQSIWCSDCGKRLNRRTYLINNDFFGWLKKLECVHCGGRKIERVTMTGLIRIDSVDAEARRTRIVLLDEEY